MKNIHILPTDKPTGIFDSNSGLQFSIMDKVRKSPLKGFHIYITNAEEIKEGDYVQHTQMFNHMGFTGIAKVGKQRVNQEFEMTSLDGHYSYYSCKEPKVILTTDQELIKDGVQAIDDEFLEWFVKNPSYEEVKVEEQYFHGSGYYKASELSEQERKRYIFMREYKIIIPKEEPKQDKIMERFIANAKQQETLEETVAKKLYPYNDGFQIMDIDISEELQVAFINGAKWQQERMYSEGEVMNALHSVELKYNRDFTKIYEGVLEYLKELKNK